MPALTRFYGILPRDLETFTRDEIDEYLRKFEQHQRDLKQAALRAKRQQGQRRR
ncbi:MAG: hypothetical protein F2534_12890 [Actinobacteria bacterium]|nr:hypothetical protein [Actinomycetota bacterium]